MFVDFEDVAVGEELNQLDHFKQVKVQVAKVSAENEIFAFDVGCDVLHVLYGLLADFLFVLLNIALKVQRLFQRREDASEHVDSGSFRLVATQKLRIPLVRDVLVNCHVLCQLEIIVDYHVRQVGKIQAQLKLLVQPLLARGNIVGAVVIQIMKFDALVGKLVSYGLGQSSDVPVA